MRNISIISVICGDYDETQWANLIACESNEDAAIVLERIKIHNTLWLQAIDEKSHLYRDWTEENPVPVFAEPRPHYDPALSGDREHMREHSRRMQEWHAAYGKFATSRLTPWSEASQKAATDIMQECLDRAFKSSEIDKDEFKYDCMGRSDNRYQIEIVSISNIHGNETKPKL